MFVLVVTGSSNTRAREKNTQIIREFVLSEGNVSFTMARRDPANNISVLFKTTRHAASRVLLAFPWIFVSPNFTIIGLDIPRTV